MTATAVLSDKVLVLNKLYEPVNVISVKKAVKKLIKKTAEIITVEEGAYCNYTFESWTELSALKAEFDDLQKHDEFVSNGLSFNFLVPRVIRSLTYAGRPRHHVKLNRRNIFVRDKNTCQYCGKVFKKDELTLEHIVPRSHGGKTTWMNIVCACGKCNRHKRDRTPREAGMQLIRQPFEPSPNQRFRITINHEKYYDWSHFVSEVYWTIELQE